MNQGMPSDADLLLLLRSASEDSFVERKTFGDWKKDALKTLVAFGNSTPIGFPAVLFIGVRDDGTPQPQMENNLDSIQKTLADITANIYPRLHYWPHIIIVDGIDVLAVIIPGSERRPHFSGPSYIRIGSKSVQATDEQFSLLIAQRTSKGAELAKWLGKKVTLSRPQQFGQVFRYFTQERTLESCTPFYVMFSDSIGAEGFPLNAIDISFDAREKRIMVHVTDTTFARD